MTEGEEDIKVIIQDILNFYPSDQKSKFKAIIQELNFSQNELEVVKKIIEAARYQISSPQDFKKVQSAIEKFLYRLESNNLKNVFEKDHNQISNLKNIFQTINDLHQEDEKQITSSSPLFIFALPVIAVKLNIRLETELKINLQELVDSIQTYTNPVRESLKKILLEILILLPAIVNKVITKERKTKNYQQYGKKFNWELNAFNLLMRLKPYEEQDSRIVIIEVTDDDLEQYEYPIPNNTLNRLINILEIHKPKVIGLNILRQQRVNNDQNLVYVCNHSLGLNDPNSRGNSAPLGIPDDRVGFSDVVEDSDSIIRRHLLFQKPDISSPCKTPYSFSFLLAAYYLQSKKINPETTFEGYTRLGKITFKKLTANAWEQSANWISLIKNLSKWLKISPNVYDKEDLGGYQLLLNYRHTRKHTIAMRFSLSSILQNEFLSSNIKDKIVIIGYTNRLYSFGLRTPYSEGRYNEIPAVELQAQMVSQIVSAVLDDRALLSFLPKWLEFIYINAFIIIGIVISLIFYQNWIWLPFTESAILIFLAIFSLRLFIDGYWIPLVRSVLALIMSSGFTFIFLNILK